MPVLAGGRLQRVYDGAHSAEFLEADDVRFGALNYFLDLSIVSIGRPYVPREYA